MVKKSRKKTGLNLADDGVYLLLSVAGGVLFSFGLLNWFQSMELHPSVPVILGAVITLGLIVFRKYTTETAFALKRRKR